MGTIALTSPVRPVAGQRVFSGGVFDVSCSGWVSTDRSIILKGRQDAPQSWLTSEASLTRQALLLFTPSLPQPALNPLLDQGSVLTSSEKMKCYFKCHKLTTLVHFDASEAFCAGDRLAGTWQGGNNLDFLCGIASVTNVKINILIITMQRWANSRVKRILDIALGKIT